MAKYVLNDAAVAKARAHKDVELAAHDLLQYLDKTTGLEPTAKA